MVERCTIFGGSFNRVSAQHFVKLQRSEIVVPAKFGDGTGFLVLSHLFVVLSFDFLFDFSLRIWYNGFGNWSGELLDKSEFAEMIRWSI